jgi:hydrogenase/urease accessory protein HupE
VSHLLGGLLHPLAVPAHAIALLALGLLIARQCLRSRIVAIVLFVAALIAGLGAIVLGVGPTSALDVLLAATALTGLLVALDRSMPIVVCGPLAVVIGGALGLDSPPEVIAISAATITLIGTGIGAALALAVIVAGASYLTLGWQRIGMRILGSWIAASAILVLALRLARGQLD